MYTIEEFFNTHKDDLKLELIGGNKGIKKKIKRPEVHRPGLILTGYLKNYLPGRVLVLGKSEIAYLKELPISLRLERIHKILQCKTPAVFLGKRNRMVKELKTLCNQYNIPLFHTRLRTMNLLSKLTLILMESFASTTTLHGTLIEVFGVGVLIQGDSSIGKSEAALGLIERGHRLISDDIVKIKKRENAHLVGYGPELTRHLMEIRGIGIINVAHLYGAVCVRPDKRLDIVVKLEEWDDRHFYDRVGLELNYTDILDIQVPFHTLPVKPGRDVVLLIETLALNHRLKDMGYNSAKEFNVKLLDVITNRRKKAVEVH